MNETAKFFQAIGDKAMILILDSIAKHYDIPANSVYVEVTNEDAEHLLDYMVEPQRSATSVLMQKYGFR